METIAGYMTVLMDLVLVYSDDDLLTLHVTLLDYYPTPPALKRHRFFLLE